MTQQIYIDPSLLGLPNFSVDSGEAENLFERLIHLAEIVLPSVPLDCIIIQEDEDEVWEANLGPDYSLVAQFLEIMGLQNVYSAADITKAYQSVTQFCDRENLSFREFGVQENDLQLARQMSEGRGPSALAHLSERATKNVAVIRANRHDAVLFSGLIYKIDHARVIPLSAFGFGSCSNSNITHIDVPVIFKFSDLVRTDRAFAIWKAAVDPRDYAFAILLGAQALKMSIGEVGIIDSKSIRVGHDFADTLQRHQAAGRDRYSSIAFGLSCQIAADVVNRPIKPFGKPDQVIRSSDNATAWRCHLTKGALALRMMMWKRGPVIEFANVGVKNALEIMSFEPASDTGIPLSQLLSC